MFSPVPLSGTEWGMGTFSRKSTAPAICRCSQALRGLLRVIAYATGAYQHFRREIA